MIWKRAFTTEDLNAMNASTLAGYVGIQFSKKGDDYLEAVMPVEQRIHQPAGIMHGGASCVLAETVGSVAANMCVDPETHHCVGLDINTSHIKMAKDGYVTGRATPVHLGGTIQVWQIHITNEKGQLVSLTRLTMAVLSKAKKEIKYK